MVAISYSGVPVPRILPMARTSGGGGNSGLSYRSECGAATFGSHFESSDRRIDVVRKLQRR